MGVAGDGFLMRQQLQPMTMQRKAVANYRSKK